MGFNSAFKVLNSRTARNTTTAFQNIENLSHKAVFPNPIFDFAKLKIIVYMVSNMSRRE